MEIIFLKLETEQSHAGRTDPGTGCELPGQEKGDHGEEPLAGIEPQYHPEAWKSSGILGSATYVLQGPKIRFVPGFNFNQKVFFHVLILWEGERHLTVTRLKVGE